MEMNKEQQTILTQIITKCKEICAQFGYAEPEVVTDAKTQKLLIGLRIKGYVNPAEISMLTQLAQQVSNTWTAFDSENEQTRTRECYIGRVSRKARPSIDDVDVADFQA